MPKWNSDSALSILDHLDKALTERKFTRKLLAERAGKSAPSTVQAHLNALQEGKCVKLAGRAAPEITPHGRLILAAWRETKRRAG